MTNFDIIIARYGEIHLKGANRGVFLRALARNIEQRINQKVRIESSRIFIDCSDQTVAKKIADTFGIVSVSLATRIKSNAFSILDYLKTIKIEGTFKVEVNRADKNFPYKSPDFAAQAGAVVLSVNKSAIVDVMNPKTVVHIDIRENGAYVYYDVIKGVGGLPVGTAGKAIVMLSGGIDSPVAAWLSAKRGLALEFIHFYSPPHTSEFALNKVRELAEKLETFCGKSVLHIVPFTEIQEEIKRNCNTEYMITLMRRFMIRIAETIALNRKIDCIITGENLSQVASQTVQSMATNNVCARVLPILRPLVTYDKLEIIELAKKIGTYDTSVQPYPDCCTVFVPRHPIIKPNIVKVEAEENKLDSKGLIDRAIASIIM